MVVSIYYVNFAWVFHQAQDSGGKFSFINFFSFSVLCFCLGRAIFYFVFWGNIYLFRFNEYSKLFPFCIVLLQMFIFSFSAEKGARYLCVVLPFMAAAGAVVIDDIFRGFAKARVYGYLFLVF